uniref:Uncharacterized protein n=1 Tax=Trichogramma kaykai TaxID=54128 RepID=A0ABD2XPK5_9HYME
MIARLIKMQFFSLTSCSSGVLSHSTFNQVSHTELLVKVVSRDSELLQPLKGDDKLCATLAALGAYQPELVLRKVKLFYLARVS